MIDTNHERRRSERFPINATVTIIDTDDGQSYTGVCCDVSRQGLGITSENSLKPDHIYSLSMNDSDVVFNARAVIAHQRQDEEGLYIIGFKADFEPTLP